MMKRWGRSGRLFLGGLLMALMLQLISCDAPPAVTDPLTRLTIGLVSYDEGARALEKVKEQPAVLTLEPRPDAADGTGQ